MAGSKKKKGLIIIFSLVLSVVFLILMGTEICSIRKIVVSGNERITDRDIIKLSGIVPGENIFKLDINKVKENLLSNPYIGVNKIERKLPDKVILNIKERKVAAVIRYLSSYLTIDEEGYILEIKPELKSFEVPIITGIKATAFITGQKIQSSDPEQIKVLNTILMQIDTNKIDSMISEINIEDPENIYFVSREGLVIKVGQALEMEKKILWIKEVLPELQKEGKIAGILDVTAGTSASYRPR